jgi:hypothetical protein
LVASPEKKPRLGRDATNDFREQPILTADFIFTNSINTTPPLFDNEDSIVQCLEHRMCVLEKKYDVLNRRLGDVKSACIETNRVVQPIVATRLQLDDFMVSLNRSVMSCITDIQLKLSEADETLTAVETNCSDALEPLDNIIKSTIWVAQETKAKVLQMFR